MAFEPGASRKRLQKQGLWVELDAWRRVAAGQRLRFWIGLSTASIGAAVALGPKESCRSIQVDSVELTLSYSTRNLDAVRSRIGIGQLSVLHRAALPARLPSHQKGVQRNRHPLCNDCHSARDQLPAVDLWAPHPSIQSTVSRPCDPSETDQRFRQHPDSGSRARNR